MKNAKILFFITVEKDKAEDYDSGKINSVIIYTISQLLTIENDEYNLIGFFSRNYAVKSKDKHKKYWIDAYDDTMPSILYSADVEGDFFNIKLEDYAERMFVYKEKIQMVKSLDKATISDTCGEISNSTGEMDGYDIYLNANYLNIEEYLDPSPNTAKELKDIHINVKLEDEPKLADFLLNNNRNILKEGHMLVIHIDDVAVKKYLNLNKTYRYYDYI